MLILNSDLRLLARSQVGIGGMKLGGGRARGTLTGSVGDCMFGWPFTRRYRLEQTVRLVEWRSESLEALCGLQA